MSFKIAQTGLRETGLRRENSHRDSLPLPFLGEEIGNAKTNGAVSLLFRHSGEVSNSRLDDGDNSCYWMGMFIRRLGPDPHANGAQTSSAQGCPDILELDNGDFAVIGVDITAASSGRFDFGASCGPDERVVRIPRQTLILAKADIPDRV